MTPSTSDDRPARTGTTRKRRALIKIITNGIGLLLAGGILLYLAIHTIIMASRNPESAGTAFLTAAIGLIFAVVLVAMFRKRPKR